MSELEDRRMDFCPTCETPQVIEDEFDDQIGFEEQAREVHVIALACGHDITWRIPSRVARG